VETADAVVIGGGIVGAATAFFLSRLGLRPVIVERRSALCTLTTPRSLEAFRAQFDHPADIAMMREGIALFERFAEAVGLPGYDISLHQQGYLFATAASDGEARIAERVAIQHAAGLTDVERLDGDEARRRFPYLSADVTAAAFRAKDGWLASHELTYGFARASKAGVLIETDVVGFRCGSRLEAVLTNHGGIATRVAVIAAGPFAARLAARVGVKLPITPVRRHRAGIKSDRRIPSWAPMTISLDDGAHWRPEGPGAWLAWGQAFDEQADEPREIVPVDWEFPALALDAVARLSPFWSDIAGHLALTNVTLEAGQYDITPDARPLIGCCGPEGLYVNAGYSGHGVMGSPGGARLLADVIAGHTGDEAHHFDPARFAYGPAVRRYSAL
jgi:sarcosine oxidase subunit beta